MNNKVKGTIFTLPEWTKRLPDDARISLKELTDILGYKSSGYTLTKKVMNSFGVACGKTPKLLSRSPRMYLVMYKLGDLRRVEGKIIN